MSQTQDQLSELMRRAHSATYQGNATTELCRVVAELAGICREQQLRIEELLNRPAPFTTDPAQSAELQRAAYDVTRDGWPR